MGKVNQVKQAHQMLVDLKLAQADIEGSGQNYGPYLYTLDYQEWIYYGQFSGEKRHGNGIFVQSSGQFVYEGKWWNDNATGNGGVLLKKNDWKTSDETWVGSFANMKLNGRGTYTAEMGSYTHVGNWLDGVRKGSGTETDPQGRIYNGWWEKDRENGEGRAEWADGSVYQGNWENGKISGFGVFDWSDGRRYVGEWRNGLMHGMGTHNWPDGKRYEGRYEAGVKNGQGKFTDAAGNIYNGEFQNGKQHGTGELYNSKGDLNSSQKFAFGSRVG